MKLSDNTVNILKNFSSIKSAGLKYITQYIDAESEDRVYIDHTEIGPMYSKKEEPKVEEITPEPEVIPSETPKEPVYKIKEEEPKKTEKKYVTLKNKRDDNYDVYDEI